ncbi:MAG: FecR domain-containing protein [Bacteroidota bacterium]
MDKINTFHSALRQIFDEGSLSDALRSSLSKEEIELLVKLQENGLIEEAITILATTDLEFNWELLKNKLDIKDKPKSSALFLNSNRLLKYAAVFTGIIVASISFYYWQTSNTKDIAPIPDLGKDRIILTQADGSKKVLSEEQDSGCIMFDKDGNTVGVQKGKVLDYSRDGTKRTAGELVYNELTVPFGKRFDVILSDGTKVSLNAGTHMKYPVVFSRKGNRAVTITGEAYFKVEKDSTRPFTVAFSNGFNIEVLGTEFNVSTYAEGVDVETVLVEGSVALSGIDSKQQGVILKPGHKAEWSSDSQNIDIASANIRVYTSWINGELIFKNNKFETIVTKLERAYDVNIDFNAQDFKNKRYDATFDINIEDVAEVMHHLAKVVPIDYQVIGKEISVVKQRTKSN